MTLADHHWSTHPPPPPPSSVTPPMIMDHHHHHHHHQQQSSLDSCSSSPGQTSLTSSHSSTSYALTDMTNHSSCSSESYMNSMCFLERKPYRPFRSNEEYLIAMKEDLAEWLNTLYGLDLNCENFLQRLETGVILCQHANSVLRKAREWRLLNTSASSTTTVTTTTNTSGYVSSSQSFASLPSSSSLSSFNGADNSIVSNGGVMGCSAIAGNSDISILDRRELVPVKLNALPGTFQARDNVANFIEWCRKIQIHECLLFETEDLVGRKNEKSFVLCLLEVARYGAKFGLLAPTLVQFEQEIDREIENDQKQQQQEQSTPKRVISQNNCRIRLPTKITEQQEKDSSVCYEDDTPQQQITNNDLESLHEKVVNLLSRCTCPVQFYLEHLSEGKYRIGDTRTLIFVRILRNHVMVRVGGGWDTLEHYLEKHDPCRGRFGHRYNQSITRVSLNSGSNSNIHNRTPMSSAAAQVILDRSDNQSQHSSASVCRSVNLSPISSRRSIAITPNRIVNQHLQESSSSINGVRRASTSSNDSHQTSSSTCSVQDYSIISTSSSTSLLPSGSLELCNNSTTTSANKTPSHNHHCHSMANFVYPDRNNNIKGLSANNNNNNSLGRINGSSSGSSTQISNNTNNTNNNKTKPQVAIKKRMNDTSVSTPCYTPNSTPTSRIPKSKFLTTLNNHRSSLTSGIGVSTEQKTPTTTVLTKAHKLKSTSICSLTTGGASRIPTSSSSTLSMDHRKLLTNYGLTPARYSSHNIYLECSSGNNNQQQQQQNQQPSGTTRQHQPQRQIPKPPPPSTVAGKINRNHNHRYDKQKLNKSTFDLISSGRMNESSNSFYSIQMPMQQQYSSSSANNNNITNNKFSKYQSQFISGNGVGVRRPSSSSSTSSSGGGSLPRTKSTTIVNSSASTNTPNHHNHHHFIKNKNNKVSGGGGNVGLQSKMTSSSLANVRVGVNNPNKRLQGSATSLNSAGSTEGGTTTGSSNGSLNESSCSILASISSSVCDGGVDVNSTVASHRRLSTPLSSNNNKNNNNLASANKIMMMKKPAKEEFTTKSPMIAAATRDNHNGEGDMTDKVLSRPIVNVSNNITNKPMVDVCSWMDRHKDQSAPSSHSNLDN